MKKLWQHFWGQTPAPPPRDIKWEWLANIPPQYGRCMSMCQFRDRILVACEYALLELTIDYLTQTARFSQIKVAK